MTREQLGRRKLDHYKRGAGIQHMVNEEAWKHTLANESYNRKMNPSEMQLKYYKHLLKLAEENGIEHRYVDELDTTIHKRQYVEKATRELIFEMRKRGIDYSNPHKRKYRFDSRGRVVEIATGKVKK